MALSQEKQQAILDAVLAKMQAQRVGPCSLCQTSNWQLVDGFSSINLSDIAGQVVLGGQTLPCVVIVCKRCGNTHLLNLRVLGLDHLLPKPEEPKQE